MKQTLSLNVGDNVVCTTNPSIKGQITNIVRGLVYINYKSTFCNINQFKIVCNSKNNPKY